MTDGIINAHAVGIKVAEFLHLIADDGVVSENDLSFGGGKFPGQQFEQSCFSQTVVTDESTFASGIDRKIDVSEEDFFRFISKCQIFKTERLCAAGGRCRKADDSLVFQGCKDSSISANQSM